LQAFQDHEVQSVTKFGGKLELGNEHGTYTIDNPLHKHFMIRSSKIFTDQIICLAEKVISLFNYVTFFHYLWLSVIHYCCYYYSLQGFI